MANLSAVYEDGRRLHEAVCEFWQQHAYDSDSDFKQAANLLAETRELATQLEKDYLALESALTKTRG